MRRVRVRAARRVGESGSSVVFFVAVMLPMFFLFFSIAVDLGAYYRTQQRAQLLLDEGALHAARQLPYRERAAEAARQYLASGGSMAAATEISVDADSITLSLQSSVPLTFAQFFLPGVAVPFTAFSSARINPLDAYIALDSSRLVAPASSAETDLFMTGLPAATYFEFDRPIVVQGLPVDPRFLTARCFNPTFSAIKRAAINLRDYLGAFRLNAVGAGIFPAQTGISDVATFGLSGQAGTGGAAEGAFPYYESIFASSVWCAGAAELERVALEQFAFPVRAYGVASYFHPDPPAVPLVNQVSFELEPQYLPALRASEAIWSSAARDEYPQTDVVLTEALSKFAGSAYQERRGLQNLPLRAVIVIASDVPWADVPVTLPDGSVQYQPRRLGSDPQVAAKISEALGRYGQLARETPRSQIELYYAIMPSPPNRASVLGSRALVESLFATAFQDPASGESPPNLGAHVSVIENPDDLVGNVASVLALSGRSVVLSK